MSADKILVQGSETVLLVDDEDMIIDVCKAMLEKLGYRVLAANNGAQAIELLRQKESNIDLVILDLIMPGMDGSEAFERIREICPEMPVILSSGYAINGRPRLSCKWGVTGLFKKHSIFTGYRRKSGKRWIPLKKSQRVRMQLAKTIVDTYNIPVIAIIGRAHPTMTSGIQRSEPSQAQVYIR